MYDRTNRCVQSGLRGLDWAMASRLSGHDGQTPGRS